MNDLNVLPSIIPSDNPASRICFQAYGNIYGISCKHNVCKSCLCLLYILKAKLIIVYNILNLCSYKSEKQSKT